MNTRNYSLLSTGIVALLTVASSCRKDTGLPAATGTSQVKPQTQSTGVGVTPAILWWATGPSIPYSDNIQGDIPTNVGSGLGFTINGIGYVCGVQMTTSRGGSFDPNQLWAYDPTVGAWVQKTSMPEVSSPFEAVAFAIGDNAYVVSGNATWQYNQPADSWTQKAPLFSPFRMGGSGFAINGKGYIGLGQDEFSADYLNDWWEYDPAGDQWTARKNFPGTRKSEASGFVAGGKGYIVCGLHVSAGGQRSYPTGLWQYDPTSDVWAQKADFPGNGRWNAVGAGGTVGGIDVGFVMGGDEGGAAYNDAWEYSPVTNSWGQLVGGPGAGRTRSASFVIGRSLFVANLSVTILNWSK